MYHIFLDEFRLGKKSATFFGALFLDELGLITARSVNFRDVTVHDTPDDSSVPYASSEQQLFESSFNLPPSQIVCSHRLIRARRDMSPRFGI